MPYIPRISGSGYKMSLRPSADVQLKQDLADAFYYEEQVAIHQLRNSIVAAMKARTYRRQEAVLTLFAMIEPAAKKHGWAADWGTKIDAATISELADDIILLWEEEHSDLAHFVVQVKGHRLVQTKAKGAKWEWENYSFDSVFFSESDAKDFIAAQRRLDGTSASVWRVIED